MANEKMNAASGAAAGNGGNGDMDEDAKHDDEG
jgi:hypothetical protein